jgi:hypothetical protein
MEQGNHSDSVLLGEDEVEKYLSEILFIYEKNEEDYNFDNLGEDIQFLLFLKSVYFHADNFDKHFGHIGIRFNIFMGRVFERKPEKTLLTGKEAGVEVTNGHLVSCYSLYDLIFIAHSLKKLARVDGFGGGVRESVLKDIALWEKMRSTLLAFGEKLYSGSEE